MSESVHKCEQTIAKDEQCLINWFGQSKEGAEKVKVLCTSKAKKAVHMPDQGYVLISFEKLAKLLKTHIENHCMPKLIARAAVDGIKMAWIAINIKSPTTFKKNIRKGIYPALKMIKKSYWVLMMKYIAQ